MGEIIHLNEEEVKAELGEMVRKTVEETLNAMLEEEADEITQAHKYERTESSTDTRAGHYHRKLVTKAGKVELLLLDFVFLTSYYSFIDYLFLAIILLFGLYTKCETLPPKMILTGESAFRYSFKSSARRANGCSRSSATLPLLIVMQ